MSKLVHINNALLSSECEISEDGAMNLYGLAGIYEITLSYKEPTRELNCQLFINGIFGTLEQLQLDINIFLRYPDKTATFLGQAPLLSTEKQRGTFSLCLPVSLPLSQTGLHWIVLAHEESTLFQFSFLVVERLGLVLPSKGIH